MNPPPDNLLPDLVLILVVVALCVLFGPAIWSDLYGVRARLKERCTRFWERCTRFWEDIRAAKLRARAEKEAREHPERAARLAKEEQEQRERAARLAKEKQEERERAARLAKEEQEQRERAARLAEEARIAEEVRLAEEARIARVSTIAEIKDNRFAEVGVYGTGKWSSVWVILESLVTFPLKVCIPKGTAFCCAHPRVQNMMALHDSAIHLSPLSQRTVLVAAACINRKREIPQSSNALFIASDSAPVFGDDRPRPVDLMRILDSSLVAEGGDPVLLQAAIWIITDDPPRGEIADFLLPKFLTLHEQLELGIGLEPNLYETAHAREERARMYYEIKAQCQPLVDRALESLRSVFEESGVASEQYRAFAR